MYQSKFLIVFFLISYCDLGMGQQWIDTVYDVSIESDISYGTSVDFKGASYPLFMDLAQPENDIPPSCGRPLMVIVHGGAWFAGDKDEGYPTRLIRDFASRGYATASINYRLGMFNSSRDLNCALLPTWKCWNMADSSEWYRANYRAIQDLLLAIEYLTQRSETFEIDPNNVFVVGESAGGFVALGAGFIDHESEILTHLIADLDDAPRPHNSYEDQCIRMYGLAQSIDEMELDRPFLGLLPDAQGLYTIRGVGSFYGGSFNNIFETFNEQAPSLYLYHQPCDLIVPFNRNKLLAGFNNCASGFPSFCQNIVNRPRVDGSNGIVKIVDQLNSEGKRTCEYFFDNSQLNYSCLEQVTNPNLGCHAIDNYYLRTSNMASYFADKIIGCTTMSSSTSNASKVDINYIDEYSELIVSTDDEHQEYSIEIIPLLANNSVYKRDGCRGTKRIILSTVPKGCYIVLVTKGGANFARKILIF